MSGPLHIIVIGGGPAGACAATAAVQAGCRVELFEASQMPRFHVGESLLPATLPLLERLGIDERWWQTFPALVKRGACFERPDGSETVRFAFGKGLPGDTGYAYQVERAVLDHALLTYAQNAGVVVHQSTRIDGVRITDDGCAVLIDDQERACDFVIDASGRSAVLARRLGGLERDALPKRAAVYGHMYDLPSPGAAAAGDIIITMGQHGWAWQIPLHDGRHSVGLVLDVQQWSKHFDPQQMFERASVQVPVLHHRLGGRMPEKVHSTSNIGYVVGQRYGPRWAAIGDAAGFVDPIFSSGVQLGVGAGIELIDAVMEHGPTGDFSEWSARVAEDERLFRRMIDLWYQRRTLSNLFFAPERDQAIERGITSLLGGNTRRTDNPFIDLIR